MTSIARRTTALITRLRNARRQWFSTGTTHSRHSSRVLRARLSPDSYAKRVRYMPFVHRKTTWYHSLQFPPARANLRSWLHAWSLNWVSCSRSLHSSWIKKIVNNKTTSHTSKNLSKFEFSTSASRHASEERLLIPRVPVFPVHVHKCVPVRWYVQKEAGKTSISQT